MRVVLVAALCLTAVLAGCADKEADLAGAIDADAAAGTALNQTVNATVNHAPLANLTADVLAGPAPLNVTFTLAGSDEDPDNLTWTLKVGDVEVGNGTFGNGTSANGTAANLTHQFLEAGNFSVNLTVSDGLNLTSANLTIQVQTTATPVAAATEDDYVIFNVDGTCDAKGEVDLGIGEYAHHRGGDSVWFYEEANGIDGLQVGGSGVFGSEEDAYVDCLNPDFLVF